jgi:hypothetical protein
MDPRDNDQYVYWAHQFHTMLPQLKAGGIKVLNHNPESLITAFPFADAKVK